MKYLYPLVVLLLLAFCRDASALDPQREVSGKEKQKAARPADGVQPKSLNPQPEVPSKNPGTKPKELNPQPEVPSKNPVINPKELNPQPEVPSKQKKKKKKKTEPKQKDATPRQP